jgi:hypothetical protein
LKLKIKLYSTKIRRSFVYLFSWLQIITRNKLFIGFL